MGGGWVKPFRHRKGKGILQVKAMPNKGEGVTIARCFRPCKCMTPIISIVFGQYSVQNQYLHVTRKERYS